MDELFGNFFMDKKVLITGHTGFIGSWLSIWLNELGANVIGCALLPYTEKDNFVVTNLKDKISSYIIDIRDFNNLFNIFMEHKPNIVFHLAAQPIVRKSYLFPKETYDINVGGTVNIFEAFRRCPNSKLLINFTTDKCYEDKEWVYGYRENDRLGGYDPYSSSKACSELITSAYRQSFFNLFHQSRKVVSSVRCGNIIGGGDWQEDRLIPDCMRAIRNNQEIVIRNPSHIRPWQYILEPIYGLLTLTLNMWKYPKKFSGAWNFGPNANSIYSVGDIVKKILRYYNKDLYHTLKGLNLDDLHETKMLLLDCSKSFRYLNWKSILDIDEIIEFMCDWYMEENINYDFDVKQINDYIKKLKENL